MTCHVIGVGSIGCLVAHSLKSLAVPTDVTLLLHRPAVVRQFLAQGGIALERHGTRTLQPDLSYQYVGRAAQEYIEAGPKDRLLKLPRSNEDISRLIVATKASNTTSAIKAVLGRLKRSSTIVILQNGMGTLEELQTNLFPDPDARPNIIMGIVDHGCWAKEGFNVVHTGIGSISLGLVPREEGDLKKEIDLRALGEQEDTRSTAQILYLLQSSPILNVQLKTFADLVKIQLIKLVVNCAINPLTAILECENGELLDNPPAQALMKQIIKEACTVLKASHASVLRGNRNVNSPKVMTKIEKSHDGEEVLGDGEEQVDDFTPNILLANARAVARRTMHNKSSMLQDRKALRQSEIDYINGYITKLGKSLFLPTPANDVVVLMLKAALKLEANRFTPLTGMIKQKI